MEVLPKTSSIFQQKIKELIEKNIISKESKILFVNDGSKDDTWNVIKTLVHKDPIFYRNQLKPKPRASKCIISRFDGSKKIL